ncbi:MAG TPA: hypothetical protein VEU62_22920 [Bryobacterales bacterium]|nr:hypothetical protein [Bryobacterales bacterium]
MDAVTRTILLAMLCGGALLGQVRATLMPQPSAIPGTTQYGVEVCSAASATVSSGLIYAAASSQISPVLPSKIEEMLGQYTRTRWQRKLLLVLEYASWGAGAAAGSGLIKIKEPGLAAAFPAVGVLLRTTTTAWKTQVPAYGMPANILPPLFQVAAGGCGEYSLFARSKPDEKPFTVEVAGKP